MASAAPNMGLPLLYNQLEPISSQQHGTKKVRGLPALPAVANVHAVPLTVDEFGLAQRHYPIIFSAGDDPVPLALMGLNEGVNTFINAEGQMIDRHAYVPAYMRRYPFLLARLDPQGDELSLCVDPTANAVGDFEDGQPLFDGDQPSDATKAILQFCEQFEEAGQRTGMFMAEIKKAGLLMDGEVAIQPEGAEQPFIYRGFQMIDEEKLRDLRGDELRKMNQSGLLPLMFAHLFSLSQTREIFARQVEQGKGPINQGNPAPQPVEA
ncbi:SapC family protein [Sphingomonas kaistensis]|uniref:SapC family protein n=1 Tax=Sphingomonas kaistensis TaxID=298708 RepID=A0ABZ2G585_9SPHN